jgi:hypothetical protein
MDTQAGFIVNAIDEVTQNSNYYKQKDDCCINILKYILVIYSENVENYNYTQANKIITKI